MTHNDLQIGNEVLVAGEALTVTDILDGYRGIGVTRTGDVHSKVRWFVDIDDVIAVREQGK